MTLLIIMCVVLGLLASVTGTSYFRTLFWVCFGALVYKVLSVWI